MLLLSGAVPGFLAMGLLVGLGGGDPGAESCSFLDPIALLELAEGVPSADLLE